MIVESLEIKPDHLRILYTALKQPFLLKFEENMFLVYNLRSTSKVQGDEMKMLYPTLYSLYPVKLLL